MGKLFLLLLFCHFSSTVKHSLRFFYTASSGLQNNFPGFMGSAEVNGILVGYCDTNKKIIELKQDWVKTFIDSDPQRLKWFDGKCFEYLPGFFKATIDSLNEHFNQTGGVHVLQRIDGCEWDDETGEVNGFLKYGYDGEDFMAFDLKTSTWIPLKPQAAATKLRWDAEKPRIKETETYLSQIFPELLKTYVAYGKKYLQRTVRPSVSLLQKTSSSPVSCHASGFYPDRASLFWRKDGEEIHEDVDHREILPNHDGTFQMSVDLKLSSVTPEDWRRYDCVFQLSGVKDDIVTRLDKDVIRTNEVSSSEFPAEAVIGGVVGLLLLTICIVGSFIWRRTRNDSGLEILEALHRRRQTETEALNDHSSQ